ncbi:MAG: hypothetical protein RLZZ67_350 [Candidatus Parcubacteria bacterium]|jgi:sulfite exporter TauE/SafE
MDTFLHKDTSGTWNTIPPIPSDLLPNVNCHKFVLHAIGKISYHEMVSNPKFQKENFPHFDFTYGKKALEISRKEFTPISNTTDLYTLAEKDCGSHSVCIGQIRDSKSGEMAHSFIIEKDSSGKYMCYEKTGFKQYPFTVHELGNLLEFINDKGERSYQNQEWRFIPKMVYSKGMKEEQDMSVTAPNWADFKIAVPVAVGFIALFVILQKAGLVNLISKGNVTYGTAFVIGLVASLSTCVAMVGGLLLSMSATFAKGGSRVKPQLMFHVGRLVSFFILGGVIGMLGATFTLTSLASSILSLGIALVMLVLGLNLLDVFPWAEKLQPKVPQFIGKHVYSVSKLNSYLTPLIVGVATFFLPCGFTQSMQLYTLGTGSFMTGGITMLAFALGTLPVLALISFSSLGITNSSKSGVFFKTAGLVVIAFALFNLINSLVVAGVITPIFNF